MHDILLLAVMFGLVAAIAWGIGDFFVAKGAKQFHAWPAAFCVNLIAAVVYAVLYGVFLHTHAAATAEDILYGLVGGAAIGLAGILFAKGAEYGPVSIVSPLSSVYPFVTTLIAIAAFDAQLSGQQLTGIGLVVAGVVVASGLFQKARHQVSLGPLFALAAALGWGVGYALLGRVVTRIGWELALLVESAGMAVALGLLLLVPGHWHGVRRAVKAGMLKYPAIWLAGMIGAAGLLAVNLGLATTLAAGTVTVAVSTCYPVITMVLSLRIFSEHVSRWVLGGAVASVAGIVLLSLG